MPSLFSTAVLVVNILFCLLTVWTSATAPESFAAQLGLAIVNPGGLNEVRAQYSGFFLAVAVVCTASLCGVLSRRTSFVMMCAVYGSLALNAGLAGYGRTIVALYVIDAIGLALAVASLALDQPGRT